MFTGLWLCSIKSQGRRIEAADRGAEAGFALAAAECSSHVGPIDSTRNCTDSRLCVIKSPMNFSSGRYWFYFFYGFRSHWRKG